jgi:hypothetical protein
MGPSRRTNKVNPLRKSDSNINKQSNVNILMGKQDFKCIYTNMDLKKDEFVIR